MNPALTYLFAMQVKNRVKHGCLELRQPGRLIGVAALVSLIIFLVRHREHEIFGWLVKPAPLGTLLLVMLAATMVRGLMRRGMAFDPADVEFLFTGPFTERQLIGYRLLSPYLSGLLSAFIFVALFGAHLQHPWLGFVAVVLFQVVCFHLTAATALYAGALPDERYERLYSLAMKGLAVLALLWVYTVTPLHQATWLQGAVQDGITIALVRLLFSPFTPVTYAGTSDLFIQFPVAEGLVTGTWGSLSYQIIFLAVLSWAVTASLALVHRFKDRFVESSILTTTRMVEERLRVQAGGSAARTTVEGQASRPLPSWRIFRGAGAIFWKNLVVASRSRRQIMLGILAVGFITLSSLLGLGQPGETAGLMIGLYLLGFLTFVLQPVFRFDLRRDAQHLVELQTLPLSSFAFVLAEIATPVVITLLFQIAGMLAVGAVWWKFISQHFVVLVTKLAMLNVLFYLTAGIVVNGVWNIHYLLVARRSSQEVSKSSVVSNLTMVFLTCFHIFPGMMLFMRLQERHGLELAAIAGMGVQLALALLVVATLAALHHRLELSGESTA